MTLPRWNLSWCDAVPAVEADRLRVAQLLVESFPEFYGAFGDDRAVLASAVAKSYPAVGTETERTHVLHVSDSIAGVLSLYPAGEIRSRQFSTLRRLLQELGGSAVGDLRKRLSDVAEPPPVPQEGLYVSRVAVGADYRGTGASAKLIARAELLADGATLSLHVRATNTRARRFYERHGFEESAERNGSYSMVKA